MSFLDRLRTSRNYLVRYILTVQKSYRAEVPYHNWFHAISVTHFAYLLIKLSPVSNLLTQIQLDMVRSLVFCPFIE